MATQAQGDPNQRICPPSSPPPADSEEALKMQQQCREHSIHFCSSKAKRELIYSWAGYDTTGNCTEDAMPSHGILCHSGKVPRGKTKGKNKVLITGKFLLAVQGGSRVLSIWDLFYIADSPPYL